MKNKLLALSVTLLLAFALFAMPVTAPIGPPPPCPPPDEPVCPCVLWIEDWEINITGPCCESRTFEVEVWIRAENVCAWDIHIFWHTTYLKLVGYTYHVPAGWGPADYFEVYNTTVAGSGDVMYYHLAISCVGDDPECFFGEMALATLKFHVEYEPCWDGTGFPWGVTTTPIAFSTAYPPVVLDCYCEVMECEAYDAEVNLIPSKPNIEVLFSKDPTKFDLADKNATGYINCTTVTAYVWISNATKLYDIHLDLVWDRTVLNADLQSITINDEAFPHPWRKMEMFIKDAGGDWDNLIFYIARPDEEEKKLKGTFWIIKIDFHVKCVYDTDGIPTEGVTPIWLYRGTYPGGTYLSTNCPDKRIFQCPNQLDLSQACYWFTPIECDFNQDGHVGVLDIQILASHYGTTWGKFDLVDIQDICLCGKYYCTSTPPEPTLPCPIYNP